MLLERTVAINGVLLAGFMSANVYFQFVITLVQVGKEIEVFFPRYQVVKFNISDGME